MRWSLYKVNLWQASEICGITLGMECSRSRQGDCWDNAPMTRFFPTLEGEWVDHRNYLSRSQAEREVLEYLEFFSNGKRKHSALGYQSPVKFETIPLEAVA